MCLSSKKVAIVGGGQVGATLAQVLLASSRIGDVVIAARNPEKTKAKLADNSLWKDLPVEQVSTAVTDADILILATPSAHSNEDIQAMAESLGTNAAEGKLVVDATNPLTEFADGLQVRWTQGASGGEVLQKCLPKAKVYKAFNTLGVEHMSDATGKDMLYCGPDQAIAELIAAVGFNPCYVGPIRYARNLEAMAELWIHCAIPPLPAHHMGRDWTFGISGTVEK